MIDIWWFKQFWYLPVIACIVAWLLPLWVIVGLMVLFWIFAFIQQHGLATLVMMGAAIVFTIASVIAVVLKYLVKFIF